MNPHTTFTLYWPARTLLAAVRLGIFEQLAMGPQRAEAVASGRGLHSGATERLLRALATMGWVEEQDGVYRNALVSERALVSRSPLYVGGIADHHAEQLWPLWEHLETAVREGRAVVREAFGGENPFDLFHQSPEGVLKFLAGMQAGAAGYGEALASAWDFRRHRHLVDFGGGSGAISGPIAQRYPHLQATILELPPVAAFLPRILGRYGCQDRLRAWAGDFFRPDTYPEAFDAALLGRVLHNWGDGEALQILQNIRSRLAPGGVVLAMESLLGGRDPASQTFAALSDLNMLVMTGGGRERTGAEYQQLFTQAGFQPTGLLPIGGPLAVIWGQKR